jgi:TetR/AcrR family transcriptional regulator, copper-responsive repressor
MMASEPKPRGRPRAYDPDLALSRARDAFWRAGYAGTSLDELATGMRMNRPSIYAAFGDKELLYLKAVARYADDSRSALAHELAQPRPLTDTLRAVYHGAARWYLAGDDGPRGCFLIGTAVTEARRNPRVRAIVESNFAAFTHMFADRFERAALDGELAPHSPTALAHIATAALNTIALRARTGAEPEVLDAIVDATVDVICVSGEGTQH